MDYDELIIDRSEIPTDWNGISKNLALLLQHAEYLYSKRDINEQKAGTILECIPNYISKQIKRLRLLKYEDPDLIAWISRNQMELFMMLRYMYGSQDQFDEVIKEQLKDLKQIEEILYPEGEPESDSPEELKEYYEGMTNMWDALEKYGINKDDLKSPLFARAYADEINYEEFNSFWKLHSKYVHPTAYFIFGKRESVYSDEAKNFFWILVQYYLARNLRDLHLMLQAISP